MEHQRALLGELLARERVVRPTLWFYTPMALAFAGEVDASAIVYDCMDELSAFLGAPPRLRELESELLRRADIVFTGGHSIYESKKTRHRRVYCFPSSVDAPHYEKVRAGIAEPADQARLPSPRIGFFGVVDERLDLALLDSVAELRPEWSLVVVGPVVKIDPASLPQRSNLHWLGGRKYEELPAYLGGWDVAAMPFAINDATRFISPTKTLEYLAAGKPVVSTAIHDVVNPYGESGAVEIVTGPTAFVDAVERVLHEGPTARAERLARGDAFVAKTSWDRTQEAMADLVDGVAESPSQSRAKE